jgi:hypothetical protein
MDVNDIISRFRFYPAKSDDITNAHVRVNNLLLDVALELNALIPDGREKSLVMTKLQEARFWSNDAIAQHGVRVQPPGYPLKGSSYTLNTLRGESDDGAEGKPR